MIGRTSKTASPIHGVRQQRGKQPPDKTACKKEERARRNGTGVEIESKGEVKMSNAKNIKRKKHCSQNDCDAAYRMPTLVSTNDGLDEQCCRTRPT